MAYLVPVNDSGNKQFGFGDWGQRLRPKLRKLDKNTNQILNLQPQYSLLI